MLRDGAIGEGVFCRFRQQPLRTVVSFARAEVDKFEHHEIEERRKKEFERGRRWSESGGDPTRFADLQLRYCFTVLRLNTLAIHLEFERHFRMFKSDRTYVSYILTVKFFNFYSKVFTNLSL